MSYQKKQNENGEVVGIQRNDGASIPLTEGNADYQKYLEWVAQGNTATDDPEMTPAKVAGRRLDAIRATGAQLLDAAGYQGYKQTQMVVFVLGEVIKTLKDVITKAGIVAPTTELDTVLAAIPYLTDLTFPQVVAMATEIGKVRGAVNALEAQMAALPPTATLPDVLAVANTEIPKPKKRRDIEEGK